MMKKQLLLLLIIFTSFVWNGCKDVCDCFKSTGPMSSEDRSLSDIHHITMNTNVDLIIHPDTFNHIRVNAGSHLISEISTKVSNGSLTIKNNNKCNWVRDFHPTIQVEVWVKNNSLSGVDFFNATGNLEMTDSLKADYFDFEVFGSIGTYNLKFNTNTLKLAINNGPSDINAIGKTNVAYLWAVGFGQVDCRGLVAGDIYMTNKGTNNNYVNATHLLDASLFGSGNIYYAGNPPTLKENILGSGQIIRL